MVSISTFSYIIVAVQCGFLDDARYCVITIKSYFSFKLLCALFREPISDRDMRHVIKEYMNIYSYICIILILN